MSKGLQSYDEPKRMDVAMRRTKDPTRGCGYWGAVSYLNSKGIRTKEQTIADAVNNIVEATVLQDRLMKREDKRGPIRKTRFRKPGPPVSSLGERSKRTLAAFRA